MIYKKLSLIEVTNQLYDTCAKHLTSWHHLVILSLLVTLWNSYELTYYKYKDSELRPVTLGLHLLGQTVLAIISLSHYPLDKPSIHTPTRAAWTLPSNPRQIPFHTKYPGQSVNCNKGSGGQREQKIALIGHYETGRNVLKGTHRRQHIACPCLVLLTSE